MRGWFLALLSMLCATAQAGTPVVVELFTSEGCSSCPPADALLAKLEAAQPVAGAEIIALAEHVDYWDGQGWRDPFSSFQFTARQREYSFRLRDGGPYTPEMVVDGASGFLGSDSAQALAAIARAALDPKAAVRLTPEGGRIAITVEDPGQEAEVWLAIVETNLQSNVSAGENAGRKLTHMAVVRRLSALGRARPGAAFSTEAKVAAPKSWKREDLRAVVFTQSRASGRILGAAEAPLSKP